MPPETEWSPVGREPGRRLPVAGTRIAVPAQLHRSMLPDCQVGMGSQCYLLDSVAGNRLRGPAQACIQCRTHFNLASGIDA